MVSKLKKLLVEIQNENIKTKQEYDCVYKWICYRLAEIIDGKEHNENLKVNLKTGDVTFYEET